MQAQISNFLGVDSRCFPENENIIIGDSSKEGGFLIHYFLNLCNKQSRPICVLALSQSFYHYNSVAQKLGSNLTTACNDTKNVHFIEGLKSLTACYDQSGSGNSCISNAFLKLINGDTGDILEYIKSSIKDLQLKSTSSSHSPIVIVDDLSVLLAAGISTKDIILFYNGLHCIVSSPDINGSLITFTNLDTDDDELEEIWTFMSHSSSLRLNVAALSTGFCKDVHGQMKVEWRDGLTRPRMKTVKHTQFKLSDKNVDLFAAGLSAAVL